MKVKSESEVTQSCPSLATPWTAAHQAPPPMGFSRQKYWSGVPLPSPCYLLKHCKNWKVLYSCYLLGFPGGASDKDSTCQCRKQERRVSSLGQEDPLEEGMATYSSILAWRIPWTEEPGGLQSMGSLESDTTERLHFHFSLSCIGEGNGNPLQCPCLENPRDGGAWWAAVMGSHRVGHD